MKRFHPKVQRAGLAGNVSSDKSGSSIAAASVKPAVLVDKVDRIRMTTRPGQRRPCADRADLWVEPRVSVDPNLHAICDSQGRPLDLFVTAGQVSDYIGARALLSSLPDVDWLLGDRGHDADWFREALKDKGTRACAPGRWQRKKTVKHDKRRYAVTGSRSCSASSRIGGVLQPATTVVRRSSCRPSLSPLSSSTGHES